MYGCRVFAFHPNYSFRPMQANSKIESEVIVVEDHLFSQNIRFYKLDLYHEDIEKDREGIKLTTLASLYEQLEVFHGGAVIDYLKIDIEGKEWKVSTKFDYSKQHVAIIFPFCF